MIAFVIFLPIAGFVGGGAFSVLDSGGFDDPTAESYQAVRLLQDELDSGDADLVPLYTVPVGAALLVVIFLAFSTSGIVFMKELGIGVALAVAIDATIVRALLVPAAMKLMGRWNWWSPRPLARLWGRAGLGDLEGHAAAAAGD